MCGICSMHQNTKIHTRFLLKASKEGRPRFKRDTNIKMDLKETACVISHRVKEWTFVKRAMNFHVP
jgi:hypothetical protein